MIFMAGLPAQAVLYAYDGFDSGGASPGSGQYATGGGFANDTLEGQGPTTTGFNSTNAWAGGGGLVDGVYFQASTTSLGYSSGGLQLDTNPGSVRFLDTFSNLSKSISRNLVDKPTPGNESWYSLVLRYESTGTWNSTMAFRVLQGGRDISLRITSAGVLEAYTTGSGIWSGSLGALAPGVDHLVVVQMLNEVSGSSDRLNYWLNPDLSSVGAADLTRTQNFLYVGNNASFLFDSIQVDANITQNGVDQFYFDEFRLGSTLADVMPTSPIPEPSAPMLLSFGLMALLGMRRR